MYIIQKKKKNVQFCVYFVYVYINIYLYMYIISYKNRPNVSKYSNFREYSFIREWVVK